MNKGKIKSLDATPNQKGISILSTDSLTIQGEDIKSCITPINLKAKLGTQEFGKIAIGQGTDKAIKWANVTSPNSSISAKYNENNNTLELETKSNENSEGNAKQGYVPIYKEDGSKTIVPSNIYSEDGLTTITKSSNGEQLLRVETKDSEEGSNAGIEAKSIGNGYPYFQLTQGEQKWRDRINPETGAREIRPVDDLSKEPALTMLPNGVVLSPFQPRSVVKLDRDTPKFSPSKEFELGSNLALTKIVDEDGYNKFANNFFVGGNGQKAYYKAPYRGRYFVKYQLLIASGETKTPLNMYVKLFWGNESNQFVSINRNRFPLATMFTLNDSEVVFLEKDEIIHINVYVQGGNPYLSVYNKSPNSLENYWEVVFLG